ncbi:hypothetical protein IDJ77_11365 [Mucilaginibacter sp. ZT4R22]|uniref:Uncharacterized protein n=1 Tax=Mucilaginibacter pankratovii TaxID=2772110 RepID=A0ABR7WQ03_9SPHI|nr:hypothetical protein [Mucilaginibacter pankratovii]MBD1364408.1 hypothetical protein [Mucilaginibacter pankratovii]
MKFNSQPGTEARKAELLAKKTLLEKQIPDTTDQAAASKLRADYRAITNEMETFYDDIKTPEVKK